MNHTLDEAAIRGTAIAQTESPTSLWIQTLLLLGLVVYLYYAIVAALIGDWWNDPNFSHGFFVPLFAGFVIWQRRRQLSETPIQPHWFGLLVIAGALCVLIVGVLGAELFLSRTSLIFLFAGMVIYFFGWGWFRKILFPWAVLFLMVPIPVIVFNNLTLPLQFLASKLATAMLGGLGVPVMREGNVITLPAMQLEVVEACSGIRSLVSLVTLAVIYGYFAESKVLRRVLLILAAIPVAVFANGVRIMGTGLLGQYWDPDKAQGFFHEFSGWVIFVLALAMLLAIHRLFRLTGPKRARVATP
ncbi:MAG TPA: exosortase A [Candidatus Acidoferrales bacterium]|nr:exosortase A [Candidatus Acidoferrales bacterium]